MDWIMAASLSALFAGLVGIFAKMGLRSMDSDVATALRTCMVLLVTWIAAAASGSLPSITSLSGETWLFLILSGLATGGSWICYFKALSLGDVNKVTPIDKSSAVLASLLAIVIFGETANLVSKLVLIAIILAGTLMMIQRKDVEGVSRKGSSWLVFALLAAIFAALTSVLGKIGIDGVDSNLGTAIRTCVVLVMAWLIVAVRGKLHLVKDVRGSELGFLMLSGAATAASWLLYYLAIQIGVVSVVVQIDKLSILVTILFSRLVLGERLTPLSLAGLVLLAGGTFGLTAIA